MPTIVSELGGVHLYSWAFSAYMLSRAITLPLFGKLADLFKNKILFAISIGTFILDAVLAGFSQSMTQVIVSRVTQGIGAGGSLVTATLSRQFDVLSKSSVAEKVAGSIQSQLLHNVENIFQPEVILMFSVEIQRILQDAVIRGVRLVFWTATTVSVITLILCWMLPKQN